MRVFAAASLKRERERDRSGASVFACVLEERGKCTLGFVLPCDACFDQQERMIKVDRRLAFWIGLKTNVTVHNFVSFQENKR